MKSSFFYGRRASMVASKIKNEINAAPNFLSALTANSPRAVGDAVQSLIETKFERIIGKWCTEYSASFSRRAMEDLAFTDKEGFYCVGDIKTHWQDASFSMPALVSVERLARFYEDDMNIFSIIMVKYKMIGWRVRASKVIFCPIEFLDWNCLTLGALGWGQIQIANSNTIIVNRGQSRKQWMLSLCNSLQVFYPKEISKTQGRIDRFKEVQSYWKKKRDIWK